LPISRTCPAITTCHRFRNSLLIDRSYAVAGRMG
jgi:hypothetical protein